MIGDVTKDLKKVFYLGGGGLAMWWVIAVVWAGPIVISRLLP